MAAAPVFDEKGLCATVGILGAGDLPDLTPALDALLATTSALSAELGATDTGPRHADV